MWRVKISKTLKHKTYFWYLYRCLMSLRDRGTITIEEIDNPFFEELYYDVIFINDYPVFIDVRDDFCVVKKLSEYAKDYILLKSNYSSALWNLAKLDSYPDGFEYRLKDWELKMMDNVKPFLHGRAFKMSYQVNELTKWNRYIQEPKYVITSMSGAGIHRLQTENRLKVFDLFDSVFGNKAKLMFKDRKHLKDDERQEIIDYSYYLKKYPNDVKTGGYEQYIKFLSMGKYSINMAGLCLSTPFRIVDSVIANRCIISTEIYHDTYNAFPCIKIPVCGYLGTGDWQMAQTILKGIDSVQYEQILQKAKNWYSWFLSVNGMWTNQILYHLKGKI